MNRDPNCTCGVYTYVDITNGSDRTIRNFKIGCKVHNIGGFE